MDGENDTTNLIALPPPFPGYELVRELGSGGMATVYLAREESLERMVAIKVMSEELVSDEFVARFDSEAKTAAQLRHPNIVVVHASGQTLNQPYIVFEYIDGGDLEERLDVEGALDTEEAASIGAKIAEALCYLHERDVVHRDLKPGNVLFSANGEPVLSDFGIAMDIATDDRLTRTGMSIGSPRYMSPEQLRGGTITGQSDMYSFGLVLLELLGGRFPPDSDPARLVSRAGRYESLVRQLLDSDPAARPTASQCVIELRSGNASQVATTGRRRPAFGVGVYVSFGLSMLFITWAIDLIWTTPKVRISVEPARAELYLNGAPDKRREFELKQTPIDLAVIASGYVGQTVSLTADTPNNLALALTPLTSPTGKQFVDFHALYDDVAVSATRLRQAQTGYPLFDELLGIRAMGTGSAEPVVQAIALRAEAGDAAAQVGAFLLATEGLASFSAQQIELWLNRASAQGGYSLASYYRALYFRQQQELGREMDAAERSVYNDFLELAQQQGLLFTSEQLRTIAPIAE